MEEVGDLLGMPIKLYKVIDAEGNELEVAESVVATMLQAGYKICPNCEPVTSFAKPMWVPTNEDQECILFLDDFTRCTQAFLQAIMQLLQFGSYGTWKLPKYCTIILSSNPEGEMYNVSDMDPAIRTRMINFNVDFDVKIWSRWADSKKKPTQLINFALWKPEIFNDVNGSVNARSYSMFMDALTDLEINQGNMGEIILIAQGVFGENQGITDELHKFLNLRLDRLPEASAIISGEWKEVERKLNEVLYEGNRYRTDIAFLLVVRLSNYLEDYFTKSEEKNKGSKIEARIVELLSTDKPLLQENSLLDLVKRIVSKYASKCPNLMRNEIIRKKILH